MPKTIRSRAYVQVSAQFHIRNSRVLHSAPKLMCCLNLNLHHFMNQVFVFCALGRTKNQLEFLFAGITVIQHFAHSAAGFALHFFALFLRRKLLKITLDFLKHSKNRIVAFADKGVKQFLLAFIIAVKRTRSYACVFYDFAQRGGLKTLFGKFPFCRRQNCVKCAYFIISYYFPSEKLYITPLHLL